MHKKYIVAIAAMALMLGGGAVGAITADDLWGDSTDKPPCSDWAMHVIDRETGSFRPIDGDAETGWSFAAAKGLLSEEGCQYIFRPKGSKEVHWDRYYELAAYYDVLVAQYGITRHREYHVTELARMYNRDEFMSYDEVCEDEDGEVWLDDIGTEWCNFGSDDFDYGEDDYVIRGPIG